MLQKGFIRILELIIFSFIIFGLMMPTFFYYSNENDWVEVNNLMICNDLLNSLEKSNVFDDVLITDPLTDGANLSKEHNLDMELLYNLTSKAFPVAFDFGYEIKNVPKYNISIGCNCTPAQIAWLNKNILTPSYPTAEFNIEQVNLDNLSSEKDLFIIFGINNLSVYQSNITEKLREGNGFVLIRDFSAAPDDFTKEIFGLNYSNIGSAVLDLKFTNLSDSKISGIAKRFKNKLTRVNTTSGIGTLYLKDLNYKINATQTNVNITGCSPLNISEGETCSILGVGNIILYQIDPVAADWTGPAEEWIDIKISGISNPRDYTFRDNFPRDLAKNNYTVLSNGNYAAVSKRTLSKYSLSYGNEPRTFWIYDYNQNKEDLNLLLKTGIIWASGEHYFVSERGIPDKKNRCTYFSSGLGGNKEPYLINLYFWSY